MIIKQDTRPNKMIWVTFRKEGMHRYPAAATDPNLATGDEYDVSFLANEHRHIFHFRVWIGVTHNDRDIEFIQFKRWLENLYKDAILSLDHKSCEMMSDDLYDIISKKYPGREIWIEVSEDGENGSFIKY
jgi:frataxin-like iron-binding protein CyaY